MRLTLNKTDLRARKPIPQRAPSDATRARGCTSRDSFFRHSRYPLWTRRPGGRAPRADGPISSRTESRPQARARPRRVDPRLGGDTIQCGSFRYRPSVDLYLT